MNALAGRRITVADIGRDHTKASTPPPEPPPQPPPKPRDKKWAVISSLLSDLVELYPSLFNPRRPKPLAVGIREAILADLGCNPAVLSYALNYWCRQPRYRSAICANDHRFGLDGMPCGDVTAEQRLHARGASR